MAPMGYTKKPLVFKVTRQAPELITPARPTPYEFKELSDIDDQEALQYLLPIIIFYRKPDDHFRDRDPAKVVKEALSKVLVPYYPFAGRVRATQGNKLVVECNGEGVIFTEAKADVTLEEFGEPLHPPFPCFDELLYDSRGTSVLDSPLIIMQVTKLKCGGFIIALRVNHTMADGQGIFQLLTAMTELNCGAKSPSIEPVWARHLLCARDHPRVTCQHRKYDEIVGTEDSTTTHDDMVLKSFCFGPEEISTLKSMIPPYQKCSTFEIISTYLWRCYAISLRLDPKEMVRMMITINTRSRFNPPIPPGYYGNVVAFPVIVSTVEKLCHNPISYAVKLVKKLKAEVTQEYMMSLADFMVVKGKPKFHVDHRTFMIADTTPFQTLDLDFGWGQPAYIGPVESGGWNGQDVAYVSYQNGMGEKGIAISLCLPRNAMEIFAKELNMLFCDHAKHSPNFISCKNIRSSL